MGISASIEKFWALFSRFKALVSILGISALVTNNSLMLSVLGGHLLARRRFGSYHDMYICILMAMVRTMVIRTQLP